MCNNQNQNAEVDGENQTPYDRGSPGKCSQGGRRTSALLGSQPNGGNVHDAARFTAHTEGTPDRPNWYGKAPATSTEN